LNKARVLNRVYASSLPGRAKTVMFYLVNRSSRELTCFPAIPTIARETGLSERTVQRALKELCEEGYIVKTPRYRKNGSQSSNLYLLVVKNDNQADNSALETVESNGEVCESERKSSEETRRFRKMKTIDFSYFDKIFIYHDCHRGGDSCVPP